MNLMLGKAGAVRGQARRPDKGHKSNGSSRKKIGTFSGEGSVMKRFQFGLEREARPQRPVGKDWIGELQLTHEKSSRLWGWRGERAAVAKANNKHTSNTRLAVGGTLKRIPRERKQKRRRCSLLRRSCDGRQRNRVSNQSPGGTPGSPGHRKAVKWAGRLGEREGGGGGLRKAAAANGQNTSQELPGAVFHVQSRNSVPFWFGVLVSLNYVLWGTSEIRENTS